MSIIMHYLRLVKAGKPICRNLPIWVQVPPEHKFVLAFVGSTLEINCTLPGVHSVGRCAPKPKGNLTSLKDIWRQRKVCSNAYYITEER